MMILKLFIATTVLGVEVTPAEKVINLLTNLKAESEAELEKETTVFNTFFGFCDQNIPAKQAAIQEDNQNIETANGGIESAKAGIATAQSDFARARKQHTEKAASLAERTKNWETKKAELEATGDDLSKANSALEDAIKHLGSSKPADLLALRSSIKQHLQLADALGLSSRSLSLLSGPGEFDFHSNDIIKILNQLKEEFEGKLRDVHDTLAKKEEAFIAFRDATNAAIEVAKEDATTAKDMESEETEKKGKNEQDLSNGEIDLANDTQFHTDLSTRCERKHKEWAQREKGRKDEIAAIEGAVEQLQTALGVETSRTVKKLLLQSPVEKKEKKTLLSKAEIEEDDVSLFTTSFLQTENTKKKGFLSPVDKHHQAREYILAQAKALSSKALEKLATSMTGPFEKVKKLIQALIERMLAEAAKEAKSQGQCGTKLRDARMRKQARTEEIARKSAELEELNSMKSGLEVSIEELAAQTVDLETQLAKDAELRSEDKNNNATALKDAKEGVVAVKEAIRILEDYYKGVHGAGGANTASVKFAQLESRASPVDEADEWNAVSHVTDAYQGNQGQANNIFGLLEVVKTDFQREIRTTEADEKQTQADYVKSKREATALLTSKRTEKKNADKDLIVTNAAIEISTREIEHANDRLAKAEGILAILEPQCVNIDMPWEERKAKIEGEIAALKKAVEILSPSSP